MSGVSKPNLSSFSIGLLALRMIFALLVISSCSEDAKDSDRRTHSECKASSSSSGLALVETCGSPEQIRCESFIFSPTLDRDSESPTLFCGPGMPRAWEGSCVPQIIRNFSTKALLAREAKKYFLPGASYNYEEHRCAFASSSSNAPGPGSEGATLAEALNSLHQICAGKQKEDSH